MSNNTFTTLYRAACWAFAVSAAATFLPLVRVRAGAFAYNIDGTEVREGNTVLAASIAALACLAVYKRFRKRWAAVVPLLAGAVSTASAIYTGILSDGHLAPSGNESRAGFGLVVLLFSTPASLAVAAAMCGAVLRHGNRDWFSGYESKAPWWDVRPR